MKKTLLTTTLLILVSLLAISCNKGKNTSATTDNGTKLDLSTWQTVDEFAIKYDAKAESLTINGGEYFQLPLPKELNDGEAIKVHLKGQNNGASGFRSWTVDEVQTTNSDIYMDATFENLPSGDFDLTYTLTAFAPSAYLFIKGPQWGTMLDKLTFTYISVEYLQ